MPTETSPSTGPSRDRTRATNLPGSQPSAVTTRGRDMPLGVGYVGVSVEPGLPDVSTGVRGESWQFTQVPSALWSNNSAAWLTDSGSAREKGIETQYDSMTRRCNAKDTNWTFQDPAAQLKVTFAKNSDISDATTAESVRGILGAKDAEKYQWSQGKFYVKRHEAEHLPQLGAGLKRKHAWMTQGAHGSPDPSEGSLTKSSRRTASEAGSSSLSDVRSTASGNKDKA